MQESTNFGANWTTTETFSTQSLPGMMVCVGPNGTTDGGAVYVVTNSGSSFASTYTFYVSTNGGLDFTLKSAQNFANYVGTNVNGRNSVQNMRTRPYPFIAADQSNGTIQGKIVLLFMHRTLLREMEINRISFAGIQLIRVRPGLQQLRSMTI